MLLKDNLKDTTEIVETEIPLESQFGINSTNIAETDMMQVKVYCDIKRKFNSSKINIGSKFK